MKNIKDFLRSRCGWNEYKIIGNAELDAVFARYGYPNPPHKMVEFLSYFYGKDLQFEDNNIDFDVKNALQCNPFELSHDGFCEMLGTDAVWPFAMIENNYITIMCDSKNNIFGIIDDYIYRFGSDYFRFIEMIAENDYSPEQL